MNSSPPTSLQKKASLTDSLPRTCSSPSKAPKSHPCDIYKVTRQCGVKLFDGYLHSPTSRKAMECYCKPTLKDIGRENGEDHLKLVLMLMTGTPANSRELYADMIKAVSSLLVQNPTLVRSPSLVGDFNEIDLGSLRRKAKAINFGIVYGISGFGLANQLGIPQSEASDYIKKYFARFPGIRDYMEETKQLARTHGFVETLFGRRIHIREINSKVPGFRGGAERAAINAPIQGTAADIIRRAMVKLPGALADKKIKATMLLQVHDELIFEAPEKETDKACKLIGQVMESAPLPMVEISVPLVVEARAADNWDAAH